MKTIIHLFSFLLFSLSCEPKKNILPEEGIIAPNKFKKNSYFRYSFIYKIPYKNDSIIPIVYSNVKPLDSNNNIPQKIYAFDKETWKKSIQYFDSSLKKKSITYILNGEKVIFRNFYEAYNGEEYYKYIINKPRNRADLIKFLEKNKLKYKILKFYKSEKSDVLNILVNEQQYKIILDSTFCKSYLLYDKINSIDETNLSNISSFIYK